MADVVGALTFYILMLWGQIFLMMWYMHRMEKALSTKKGKEER